MPQNRTQVIADLHARRDTILNRLASLDGGKGDHVNSSIDGESHDHVGYKDGLYRELKNIEELLALYGADGSLGAPVESETFGII